ncbi:MAG: NUDIX domain-containing protein, partial [Clostridia bacterium]|nr:NUDIX domain-containing protein [Clostridia bacterium]
MKPYTDVAAALVWDGDRFLICRRPTHKSNALLWEFVGGKAEPGETLEETLIRECREELAITVEPREPFMQ